jgi:hypothetical protein
VQRACAASPEAPRQGARRAAQRGNVLVAYILGQRAALRSRLVHAALAEKLPWGSASLAGFAPATAVNLDSFDEQPDARDGGVSETTFVAATVHFGAFLHAPCVCRTIVCDQGVVNMLWLSSGLSQRPSNQ